MSGYKRVSFYELCRLCASNTQKEKTHIFHEEGRKIQLQNKIQTCLALTVNENDFLPKVVCSKCLRSLETCFGFQQECVRSESMLSTYFKKFRYTDDFKYSGKVYIKDIKPPPAPLPAQVQQNPEVSTSNNLQAVSGAALISLNKNQGTADQVPFYTLQLPTIVTNPNVNVRNQKSDVIDNKLAAQVTQNQFAYNLNLINTSSMKTTNLSKNEVLSNVVVNSNGEVINIAQMGDFETIINHNVINKKVKSSKRSKQHKYDSASQSDSVVKIDLTNSDNISPGYDLEQANAKYDKLPHIKSTQSNKYTYPVKVEDKNQNPNQTVIFPISEFNQQFNNFNNNSLCTQPNLNIPNNATGVNSNQNVMTATNVEGSAVSINVLNEGIDDLNQDGFANVSNVPSDLLNAPEEDTKINMANTVVSNDNNTGTTTSTVKLHVCDICSRVFKRREHLYQHVKLHTGFRPFICEHCNKAFMRKEHLLRHSTLHSGQKNFTCNICDKSFSRNDNLLKHKKTHEKQSSYTCEICQKQFVMRHYYNAHKLTHGDKCYVNTVWGMLKT